MNWTEEDQNYQKERHKSIHYWKEILQRIYIFREWMDGFFNNFYKKMAFRSREIVAIIVTLRSHNRGHILFETELRSLAYQLISSVFFTVKHATKIWALGPIEADRLDKSKLAFCQIFLEKVQRFCANLRLGNLEFKKSAQTP